MATHLELGLDTFGDITTGPDGQLLPHAQVIRDVIDEAILADTLGVDFFGVGEHHRADFAVSAPDVVLAAIAGRTSRMRLGSAVTVLSSDDPVRVVQRFATLDAASSARRSSSAAARSPNPFPCSDTSSASTRSCSKTSSTCSRR
jgi:hypothetical protein